MTIRHIRIALVILSLATLTTFFSCTFEEAGDLTRDASETSAAISRAVPGEVGLYFKLVGGILSLVSSVAFGLHKWRNEVQLKEAIRTRSNSIELAKRSEDEGLASAAKTTLDFVAKIESASNPRKTKYGGLFDAVRKGIR